jgi:hypothetical protein
MPSSRTPLATLDDNADGVIDANDTAFAELRVWVDGNSNAETDPGELQTLDEAGGASISLATLGPSRRVVAGNQVAAEGTFTRTDGSTGAVFDVRFRLDNFDSVYLGDTTVSAEAAALPNIKGRGTLADLHVAMSHDPALLQTVAATMPSLTAIDLDALRAAAMPIFEAWGAPDTANRPSIPILFTTDANGNRTVADFAIPLGDGDGWALASGDDVVNDVLSDASSQTNFRSERRPRRADYERSWTLPAKPRCRRRDLEALRTAIRAGLDSGSGVPADQVFAELRARDAAKS